MEFAKSLLQPLSSSAVSSGVLDATKLVILGGTVETARRAASSGWNSFVNSFYLTAHFCEDDYPYDWLLGWLSKQPAWTRSREFEATTSTVSVTGRASQRAAGDEVEEDTEDVIEEDDGRPRLKVHFQPTLDTTHTIYYKGHLLRIRRSKKTDGSELSMLTISVVARSNGILKQLVLQAKREYEQECVDRVQIYFADQHGSWRWSDSRHKRPLSSIVLNPGVIEMLVADAKDFLRSERWYASRGIPYRRGYLLHGTPGAGKSSLIHALAGELALDVYIVSLSASWINDASLTSLLGRIPARSILLLEDIDAAFTRSTSRDKEATGAPASKETKDAAGPETKKEAEKDDSKLSLSGLLNALDGMQASEARLLFCTTNHLERLDPALSRPGRMDLWIEFGNSTKYQAESLFRNFFPVAEEFEAETTPSSSLFSSYNSSTAATPATESAPSTPAPSTPAASAPSADVAPQSLRDTLPSLESASSLGTTLLDAARLSELAKAFAEGVPDKEFSVAELQGYLLKHKSRPEEAVRQVAQWVIKERELRERLAREREEREEKERLAKEKRRKERDEKARKEKEEADEKARKEKEEKEKKEKEEKDKEEKEKKEKEEADAKARKEAAEKEKQSSSTSADTKTEVEAVKPQDD